MNAPRDVEPRGTDDQPADPSARQADPRPGGPRVSIGELEDALMWTSTSPEFYCRALISLDDGRIWLRNVDGWVEGDAPDEGADYLEVPHKNDLDLGRELALRFADDAAPRHVADDVYDAFRRKGAYRRFKDLLDRHDLLEAWYEYERRATIDALERWAAENGLVVDRPTKAP